jgi:hypothetical protein
MNIKTKEIYSEVYQVLNLLGNEYIDKLPTSLINMLKEKREINYNPQYTDDIPLNEQNIKKETISIIVLLYLNYWCKNDNEISEVKNILKENENKYQVEPREKHNPDNIFSNQHRNSSIDNAQNNQELSLIERKNIKWYKKIWKTIKNFFRK